MTRARERFLVVYTYIRTLHESPKVIFSIEMVTERNLTRCRLFPLPNLTYIHDIMNEEIFMDRKEVDQNEFQNIVLVFFFFFFFFFPPTT